MTRGAPKNAELAACDVRFELALGPRGSTFYRRYLRYRDRLADGNERSYRVGYECGLGLLIRSGLWARLSAPAQAIAAVLLEFGEKDRPLDDTLWARMAYRTLARYSGVQSHNAIRKGLVALGEVGFLVLPAGAGSASLDRQTATYLVTPNSHALSELAQTTAWQTQQEIAAEVELRKRQRNERLRSSPGNRTGSSRPPPRLY